MEKETVRYTNHQNIHYKFVREADGWWSIYKLNTAGIYRPILQAKDLKHCKSYCDMVEESPIILTRI